MRRRLLLGGWALVVSVSLLLVPRRDAEGSLVEERLVLLDVGNDGGFRVRVDSNDAVRIVAQLEVPENQSLDPLRQWNFGVGLSLLRSGGETVAWSHNVVSRVLVDPDGHPLIRSSRPGRRVTDSRVIDLDAGFADGGGLLEVTPAGLPENTRLLLRIFEVTGGTEPGSLLDLTWPRPYPALTTNEVAWYSKWRRRSLAPDFLVGDTVSVLRRPRPEKGVETVPLRRLEPGQATAFNVVGPAHFTADAVQAGLGTPFSDALRIDVISDATAVTTVSGTFEVPEGETWSLRVFNNATVAVNPILTPMEQPARWGDPPLPSDIRLRPEERRIRLFRLGDEHAPLRIPVDSGTPTGLLRVDARPSHPGEPVRVNWIARDGEDNKLAEGEVLVPWLQAPFERYTDAEDGDASEPTTRFVLHPQATRTIEWSAPQDVDVRFLVPLGVDGIRPDVYGLENGYGARYVPWELAPWVSLAPEGLAGVIRAERVKTLIATVRFEPKGASRETVLANQPIDTDTVFPSFSPPRFPMLEPSQSGGPFQRWHRNRMGTRQRLVVPDDGIVKLEHRLSRSKVGEVASLRCGGVTSSQRVRSSRGLLRLYGLPAGSHTCTFTAPSGMWFAKHPGGGERWAHRTLYRVDDRTVLLRIPELDGVQTLYLRAYTASGAQAPTIITEVDGGIRQASTQTVAQHTAFARYFVPDEVTGGGLLDNGGAIDRWTGMRLVMGEDLSEGEHTIEVRATSPDGTPVYVRFDATWDTPTVFRTLHWPEVGE